MDSKASSKEKNEINKPLSNKLPYFILLNIFSYIDLNTNIKKEYFFLDKKLFKLFKFKKIEVEINNNHEIGGTYDMNVIYCEYDLDYIANENKTGKTGILNIELEIESHDQGWASVTCSSSWVEMNIIDKKNPDNILQNFRLFENFRISDYKNYKINLKNLLNSAKFNEILKVIRNEDCKIQIVARSMYPGWECYVKKCNAKFIFLKLDI